MQNSLQLSAVDSVKVNYQIESTLLNMVIFCEEFGEPRVCAANIEAKQKIYVMASVHGRHEKQEKMSACCIFLPDVSFSCFLECLSSQFSIWSPKRRCKEPPANVWNWQTSDRQLAWKPITVVSLALAKSIIWSPRSIHKVAFFDVCIWSSRRWWMVLASIFQETVWNSAFLSDWPSGQYVLRSHSSPHQWVSVEAWVRHYLEVQVSLYLREGKLIMVHHCVPQQTKHCPLVQQLHYTYIHNNLNIFSSL